MIDYWMTLDIFQKVLTIIAVPASIVLVVEFVRIIIVSGRRRARREEAGEEAAEQKKKNRGPCINGSPLITVRGLCAFLSIGAWAGVLSINLGCADWVGGLIAAAAGIVAAVLMALAFNLD